MGPHARDGGGAIADKLPPFSAQIRGFGPRPERELREKFRSEAQGRWGAFDFDVMARDDGRNAWGPFSRPSSNSAFERPYPPGRLWRFPSFELVGLVLTRLAASLREDLSGAHLCMFPSFLWKNWNGKLAPFEQVSSWPAGASLFADPRAG